MLGTFHAAPDGFRRRSRGGRLGGSLTTTPSWGFAAAAAKSSTPTTVSSLGAAAEAASELPGPRGPALLVPSHCPRTQILRGGQISAHGFPRSDFRALPPLPVAAAALARCQSPSPLILGLESFHRRLIVATRAVRVGSGASPPLRVRDHQRRPYRDALTALDDTSSWRTSRTYCTD